MDIYDVTNVIVDDDKVICALFDGRYDAIAIIKISKPDDSSKCHLNVTDPDGAERLYWLDRLGLLPEDELINEAEKLKKEQKRTLYEKLKLEFEEEKEVKEDATSRRKNKTPN